jgi:DNA-directed RNA polymerase III subunit RPC3
MYVLTLLTLLSCGIKGCLYLVRRTFVSESTQKSSISTYGIKCGLIFTNEGLLLMHSQIFVASASQRYNVHAGSVLRGALTASLPSERATYAVRSEPLSYHAITRAIPESDTKLRGISLSKNLLNDIHRDDDAALQNLYVKEYVNILCATDNPSIAGKAAAFMSLTISGGASSKRVAVEYDLIAKRLRALVLDNLVRDKWGIAGLRILNILRDCGKLDGEQVRVCS